jgi:hypothetical protein
MNTFPTGPSSSSQSFAPNFVALVTRPAIRPGVSSHAGFLACAMLLCVGATLHAASPASPPRPGSDAKATYSFTLSIHLSCPLSDGGAYSKTSLFEDNNGFDGCSDAITLESGRQVVTYTLISPTSSLPCDAEVALITVVDASCGGTHTFIVQTDGIGSVLVMDEL